ncbi:MAG: hypothetical protein AAF566_07890 [Pseudomonadota bacterium]
MAVAQVDPIGTRRVPVAKAETSTSPVILFLFMAALMMPVVLNFGQFALSPSRLFCLVAFFPCLFLWVSGRLGPWRPFDFLLIFSASWAALSFLVNHGIAGGYERAGFTIIEWVGGYFFGRAAIRCAKDFRTYLRMVVIALMFMLPFAILETQTGTPIIIEILSRVIETENIVFNEARLGLERAQVIFPHPILYGIFCAAMLAPVVRGLNMGAGTGTIVARFSVITVSTICSVSSGAWLLYLIQAAFLIYDRVMRAVKQRWFLLFLAVVFMYVAIDIAANSSPVKVFVRYLTLNSASGHYRIAQFDAAIINVFNNPFFGLGSKDWIRPRWMISSIDNYWMVLSVRHGAVLFFVFLIGILISMYQISRSRPKDPEVREMRVGYLISLGSFLIAVVSVHVWSNMNVWFMFFLGAGAWFIDAEQEAADEAQEPAKRGRQASSRRQTYAVDDISNADAEEEQPFDTAAASRYSRFPAKSRAPAGATSKPRGGRKS